MTREPRRHQASPGTQVQIAEAGLDVIEQMFVRQARRRMLPAEFSWQADAEHRLEIMLRIDLEGDVCPRLQDSRNLREPRGHDLGDLFVVLHPEHRHEVEFAGDGIRLGNARHVGERRPEPGDGPTLSLDQHDGRDHEGDSLTSLAALKTLTLRTYVRIIFIVKMGVGGNSTRRKWRLDRPDELVAAMDEYIERTDREIEERRASRTRVLRARRHLELLMWRTSPLFCKTR